MLIESDSPELNLVEVSGLRLSVGRLFSQSFEELGVLCRRVCMPRLFLNPSVLTLKDQKLSGGR